MSVIDITNARNSHNLLNYTQLEASDIHNSNFSLDKFQETCLKILLVHKSKRLTSTRLYKATNG